MPHRAFTDANGILWQVWEVIPQWAERRTGTSRRAGPAHPAADDRVVTPRRNADRRRGLPDNFPRIKLGNGLDGGWLAFESTRERRRLAPIPSGWDQANESELERLCRSAAAAGTPRRLIE